jgi:ferredoxin
MNPLLASETTDRSATMRIAELKGTLEALLFIIFVTFMQNGPGRMMKRKFQQQMARGETIWLDDLETRRPLPPEQERRSGADVSADISPNHAWQPRKSRAIKLDEYPEAAYPFSYRRPPLSGNVINGLGEKQTRPARKVFHSGDYRVAWGGLERYFHAHANDTTIKKFRKIRWQDRQKDGRAASVKYQVDSPEQMAVWVKEAAAHFGGQLVGVAPLSAEHTFEHFDPALYDSAICIAVTMDLDSMRYATSDKASTAVVDGYSRAATASVELAKRIRALGWKALAASNVGVDTAEVLHLPLAVQAGLGQLGKHGSLITKEFGSNLRLATVLTNMPLAYDEPVDSGVDDFCESCQICVTNCPPQAIFDTKQMVRGVEKWYVDFDKCVPYFAMNNSCGICVAVCPWTEPGLGESISLKMLAKRIE